MKNPIIINPATQSTINKALKFIDSFNPSLRYEYTRFSDDVEFSTNLLKGSYISKLGTQYYINYQGSGIEDFFSFIGSKQDTIFAATLMYCNCIEILNSLNYSKEEIY